MTTTMQGKIEREIDRRLGLHKLEAVRSFGFSNDGTYHVQKTDSMETLFRLVVSYQTSYMTAGFVYANERMVNSGAEADCGINKRTFHHLEYHDIPRMTDFFEMVTAHAKKGGPL